MDLDIRATANVETVEVEDVTTAAGTIEFDVPSRSQPYPLHTVFCIDVSSSMKRDMQTEQGTVRGMVSNADGTEPKIDVAKRGLKQAIDDLSADDSFGVVSFSSSVESTYGPTTGRSARQAKSAVGDLSPGGGTNIRDGLDASKQLLDDMPRERAIEWIVLISDGRGTMPGESELQRTYNDNGITIQCAGVGDKWDEDGLLNISQQTRGGIEHVRSGGQLQKFFRNQVRNARNVVAVDTELEISPSDHVTIDDVSYTTGGQHGIVDPEWQGGNCIVDLGDIDGEDLPRVKTEMEIDPKEPDLALQLLTATLQTGGSGVASDRITVEAIKRRNLGAESAETTVKPGIDAETAFNQIVTLGGQGKLDEARAKLDEHHELLASEGRYQDAKQRLDDFETSETGTTVRGLSTDDE